MYVREFGTFQQVIEFFGVAIGGGLLQGAHGDDADYPSVVVDRPGAKLAGADLLERLLRAHGGFQKHGGRAHGVNDQVLSVLGTRFGGGQVNAVLIREDFVDGLRLQTRRDEQAHEVGNHQRNDHGIIAGDLENHQDGGHGRAHDAREGCAHSDQSVHAGRGDVAGQQIVRDGAYDAPEHGAQEQAGSENAAGISGRVADGHGEELQYQKQGHEFKGHATVQGFANVLVTDAEGLRYEPAHDSYAQAAGHGLKPNCLSREAEKAAAQTEEQLGEGHRHQAAHHAEN